MFTGIIEQLAEVVSLQKEGENLHITMRTSFTQELKIDQSVAHNGVCLTVVKIDGDVYTVTAIRETLDKTNLSELAEGDSVNLPEGGSLKKFPRGLSGRAEIFSFKPLRFKILGSILANGMIKNMSK